MARKATAAKKQLGARVIVRQRLGRKPPPPNETRRDRFLRIAQRRMSEVLNKIALLGNLSSPSYECAAEDVDKMREAVITALEASLSRFRPRSPSERRPFDFGKVPTAH